MKRIIAIFAVFSGLCLGLVPSASAVSFVTQASECATTSASLRSEWTVETSATKNGTLRNVRIVAEGAVNRPVYTLVIRRYDGSVLQTRNVYNNGDYVYALRIPGPRVTGQVVAKFGTGTCTTPRIVIG